MADTVDYLQESLQRGGKFEIMMTTDGWKLIEAYITNNMQDIANRLFTSDGDIAAFQHEVDEIRGLRKLLASISHDVDTLHEQRRISEQQTAGTTEPAELE